MKPLKQLTMDLEAPQPDPNNVGQLAAFALADRLETKAANRAINDLVARAKKRDALVSDEVIDNPKTNKK